MSNLPFWSDKTASPRFKRNFLVEFPSGILKDRVGESYKWLIKSCTRPKATAAYKASEAANFNNYAPLPPSPTYPLTWNTIQIKFSNLIPNRADLSTDRIVLLDEIFNPLVQSLFQIDEKSNNDMAALSITNEPCAAIPANQRIRLTKQYFGEYIIIQDYAPIGLNGQNENIGSWFLREPWVTDIDFGAYDYSSDDELEISVSFGYLKAEYVQAQLSKGKSQKGTYTTDLSTITPSGQQINAEVEEALQQSRVPSTADRTVSRVRGTTASR